MLLALIERNRPLLAFAAKRLYMTAHGFCPRELDGFCREAAAEISTGPKAFGLGLGCQKMRPESGARARQLTGKISYRLTGTAAD